MPVDHIKNFDYDDQSHKTLRSTAFSGLATPFDFTSFSSQPFLRSWPQLFTARVFLVGIKTTDALHVANCQHWGWVETGQTK